MDASRSDLVIRRNRSVQTEAQGHGDRMTHVGIVRLEYPKPVSGLVNLNLDVQIYLMSLLDNASLARLVATCHHFLEVGIRALCGRSGKCMYYTPQLLSFLSFLRTDAPDSRSPFIKELDIDTWTWPGRPHAETDYKAEPYRSALAALLKILRSCHNLRSLRIECGSDGKGLPMDTLYNTFSGLRSLQRLFLPVTQRTKPNLLERIGALPQLETLALRWRGDQANSETVRPLLALHSLCHSLVELCLSTGARMELLIPPHLAFERVRRLSISIGCYRVSFDQLTKRAFPALLHLTLTSDVASRARLIRRWAEEHREYNRQRWEKDPSAWPPLVSLAADDSGVAYTLAIPQPVSFLSLQSPWDNRCEAVEVAVDVIKDARPVCLEVRITGDGVAEHSMYDALYMANGPDYTLERCIITFDIPAVILGSQSDAWKLFSPKLDALVAAPGLRKASLTHLLVRHLSDRCGPWHGHATAPPILADPRYQFTASTYSYHEGIAPQMERFAYRCSSHLRWVGFCPKGSAPRFWKATHHSGNTEGYESDGSDASVRTRLAPFTTLEEADEDTASRVLKEDMQCAPGTSDLWHWYKDYH
ncbi:hypothetical protein BV20DRAFT_960783 [Pilatotrama ljubarskyi]|nr:hypothetical protein BV20DRAFT_960783 [Pilatotrama ljubarskyi]